jgi:hypothetical protein
MLVRFALAFAAAALIAAPLALVPGAASASSAVTELQAERYFTCPSGYVFRAASDAAHCKKHPRYGYRGLVPCPNNFGVGLFAKTDAIGRKDMCTGTNPVTGEVAVERGCPAAPDSDGKRFESVGSKQQSGGQLFDDADKNESGAGKHARTHEGERDPDQSGQLASPESPGRFLQIGIHPPDRVLGSTHRLGEDHRDVDEQQERRSLVEGSSPAQSETHHGDSHGDVGERVCDPY